MEVLIRQVLFHSSNDLNVQQIKSPKSGKRYKEILEERIIKEMKA